jgi:hypothetical protein
MPPHTLRCYDYVNRSYAIVSEALAENPTAIFERATMDAAKRANALAATLRVELGGIEVGTDIAIEVTHVERIPADGGGQGPRMRIDLRWKALRAAGIFPSMEAELSIYPLSADETQLDLHGTYKPPLGALGGAVDRLVGHRIAEASVHRFIEDVAKSLRSDLPVV